MAVATAKADNITFADANVKALCVANWDTNYDGELSTDEAATEPSTPSMPSASSKSYLAADDGKN